MYALKQLINYYIKLFIMSTNFNMGNIFLFKEYFPSHFPQWNLWVFAKNNIQFFFLMMILIYIVLYSRSDKDGFIIILQSFFCYWSDASINLLILLAAYHISKISNTILWRPSNYPGIQTTCILMEQYIYFSFHLDYNLDQKLDITLFLAYFL